MIENDPNDIACGHPAEGAALGLLGLMRGLSEELWCAGWINCLEYSLWNVQPGMLYGQGSITERQSILLRLLSEECDGWWFWNDCGPEFILRADWQKRADSYLNRHPEGPPTFGLIDWIWPERPAT